MHESQISLLLLLGLRFSVALFMTTFDNMSYHFSSNKCINLAKGACVCTYM